jgi:hypothetical protein
MAQRSISRIKTSLTILRLFTGVSGPSAHELVTDNLLAISTPDVVSNGSRRSG